MTTEKTELPSGDDSNRICGWCAEGFQPSRSWSAFCSNKCRTDYSTAMKSRGGPMAPLVLAWIDTRHAKAGSRNAAICAFARSELTMMAAHLNGLDIEEGRLSAVEHVGRLMDSGVRWMDRRR